jgi:hypothetical protein
MRVAQGLSIRLGEGDRLGIVADILEEGEDGHAILQARRPDVNAHELYLSAWPARHGAWPANHDDRNR